MSPEAASTPDRDFTRSQETAIEAAMLRGMSMSQAIRMIEAGESNKPTGEYTRTHTGPNDTIPFIMSKTALEHVTHQPELPIEELKTPLTVLHEAWIERKSLEEEFANLEFILGVSPKKVGIERAKDRTTDELRKAILQMQSQRRA